MEAEPAGGGTAILILGPAPSPRPAVMAGEGLILTLKWLGGQRLYLARYDPRGAESARSVMAGPRDKRPGASLVPANYATTGVA